jgi:small-conductance mechanosensitive channel
MLLKFANFIHEFLGLSISAQTKIFSSLVVIIFFGILEKLIKRFFIDKIADSQTSFRIRKIISYTFATIAILLLIKIWFGAITGISTYLGLLSAGLAVALQDPIVNIAAWFFITIRRPFVIGDRIEINNIIGDVIDIRIFQFTLVEIRNWVDADQSTGRLVHVPNSTVFKSPQMNYTSAFKYIWEEIPVLITFESNWEKTKKILTEIVNKRAIKYSASAEKEIREAARKYYLFYDSLKPEVYTDVKDSGVQLTIRLLCSVRQRRKLKEQIWEDILTEFAKHNDIDLAYPTVRYYNNLTEGKSYNK